MTSSVIYCVCAADGFFAWALAATLAIVPYFLWGATSSLSIWNNDMLLGLISLMWTLWWLFLWVLQISLSDVAFSQRPDACSLCFAYGGLLDAWWISLTAAVTLLTVMYIVHGGSGSDDLGAKIFAGVIGVTLILIFSFAQLLNEYVTLGQFFSNLSVSWFIVFPGMWVAAYLFLKWLRSEEARVFLESYTVNHWFLGGTKTQKGDPHVI